jgi:hypothetical protein
MCFLCNRDIEALHKKWAAIALCSEYYNLYNAPGSMISWHDGLPDTAIDGFMAVEWPPKAKILKALPPSQKETLMPI